MKKLFISAVYLVGFNILMAQNDINNFAEQVSSEQSNIDNKGQTISPPTVVINKFNTNFPNINVNWQRDGDLYAAHYHDEGTKMERCMVYDKDGNIVRSDNEVNDLSYPKPIGDYYAKTYPAENYKVVMSNDKEGKKLYYINRKSTVIWFDKDGNHINSNSSKNKKATK